jgi:hypothetical protein
MLFIEFWSHKLWSACMIRYSYISKFLGTPSLLATTICHSNDLRFLSLQNTLISHDSISWLTTELWTYKYVHH